MPNIKLTQMSVATTLNATDSFMIVQDGVNKKSSTTNILKNLNSVDSIRVNPLQNTINFSVASKNDANLLVVVGSSDRLGIGTSTPQSKVHIIGNVQVGSTTVDGVLVQSSETITYTAADQTNSTVKIISPLRSISSIDCNTGVSGLFSLSAGFNGEVKTIVQNTLDVGEISTISCTGLGFNTITFDTIGNSTLIQYISSIAAWIVIGGNGAIYSTV